MMKIAFIKISMLRSTLLGDRFIKGPHEQEYFKKYGYMYEFFDTNSIYGN